MSTFNNKHLSQIPLLQALAGMGYEYLSPQASLPMRGNRLANVLLESVLHDQLVKINRIHYKGKDYPFSEDRIQEAIQKLKLRHIQYAGLQKTNEAVYDLITLGTALEQSIEGSLKSYTLNYIDWKDLGNNVFHMVPEFVVERSQSLETISSNVALFVNGIPLCIIECESPEVGIEQAVSRITRNQDREHIPGLFSYVQLVVAVNQQEARYATAGSQEKYWSAWKELEDGEEEVAKLVNTPMSEAQSEAQKAWLFSGDLAAARQHFEEAEGEGERPVTEQDRTVYSLCRPERLLNLTYRFTLFEAGTKKIARYQQYFGVRATLAQVGQVNAEGIRRGGTVWHTQGSGKSLAMVMLVRNLALDATLVSPRILLVSDREDLDKQLGNTFAACGLSKERATSGRNLVKHLKNKVGIITTLIHKFDKGWTAEKFVDESPDIFVLVDESHRTTFGTPYARMRQMLPNACFLGFTGTPLTKQEKSSSARFGELIRPYYAVQQAVKDKVVLPLLYESRQVQTSQQQAELELWLQHHSAGLTQAQQAALMRRHAHAETLNEEDQVIYRRALDISEDYRANWQGTGFKAQLVAPTKAVAIKYHDYLQDLGQVTSALVMSAPETGEGHEDVNAGPTDEVGRFWEQMMERFGSEEEYTTQVISNFRYREEPEILIVIDKLLTGFGEPRNTVLYLCRTLKEHALLQAIARVNRLYEGKDFGFIVDYTGILGDLDKALTQYDALEAFDEEDLAGTLLPIKGTVQQLAQAHSHLWDLFHAMQSRQDDEAFETLLADDMLRQEFYERLTEYSKVMGIALSSHRFLEEVGDAQHQAYKQDLGRFHHLKSSVRLRYGDATEYNQYASKVKKLLDTHLSADEALSAEEPNNVYDQQQFGMVKEGQGSYSAKSIAARADIIAHAAKRLINDKLAEDPVFYGRFSELIQQTIDDFRAARIPDVEYLNKAGDLAEQILSKRRDDVPESIQGNDEACAYYGAIHPYFLESEIAESQVETACVKTALAIQQIVSDHWKVDFAVDTKAQQSAVNAIDDFLYDEMEPEFGISLSTEQKDQIIDKSLQIAKSRDRNR